MKFKVDKTSLKYKLQAAIGEAAGEVLGEKIKPEDVHLEHPENEKYGDYASNIAIAMFSDIKNKKLKIKNTNKKSKNLKPYSNGVMEQWSNLRQLAEAIIKILKQNKSLKGKVESVEVAGAGFINIKIKNDWLIKQLQKAVREGKKYGTNEIGKGQKWLIEHTSPNPNKAIHLGHLRNNVTGMAIANNWENLGIKVIRDCIDNNRGIAIAKLMWGYLKFARKDGKEVTDIDYWYNHQGEWQTPKDLGMRPDRFVDQLYVKASEDFKKKEVEEEVRKLVIDWEKEDKKTWALWRKVLSYSYAGQQLTLKRLGNKWDKIWHEHEHYKKGKDLVKQGLKKGIFKKLEDGAVVSDLSKYNLPDTILIKSDGSALYITQDLALTKLKRETFKPDRLFWVIGPEQSLALKQLFAICEQLGIGKVKDYTHIAYGYMSIKGKGKMSSRQGTVVYIDDLIDRSKKIILKKIDKENFKKDEVNKLAEKIALGAVKYSILKVRRMADIAFDFGESLAFEGNSGPYLQYTFARTQSVLAKATSYQLPATSKKKNWKLETGDWKLSAEEISILRWLYRYPEVVFQAGKEYAPNIICNFLHELAQRFNTFYAKHSILQPQNAHVARGKLHVVSRETTSHTLRATSQFRLLMTASVGQVLSNGLTLLGIEPLEKM